LDAMTGGIGLARTPMTPDTGKREKQEGILRTTSTSFGFGEYTRDRQAKADDIHTTNARARPVTALDLCGDLFLCLCRLSLQSLESGTLHPDRHPSAHGDVWCLACDLCTQRTAPGRARTSWLVAGPLLSGLRRPISSLAGEHELLLASTAGDDHGLPDDRSQAQTSRPGRNRRPLAEFQHFVRAPRPALVRRSARPLALIFLLLWTHGGDPRNRSGLHRAGRLQCRVSGSPCAPARVQRPGGRTLDRPRAQSNCPRDPRHAWPLADAARGPTGNGHPARNARRSPFARGIARGAPGSENLPDGRSSFRRGAPPRRNCQGFVVGTVTQARSNMRSHQPRNP